MTVDLTAVTEAKGYVDLSAKLLEREVVKARRGGATWQQLGDALGITQQGARARWNPKLKALAEAASSGQESPNGSHPDAAGLTWPSPVDASPL